MLEAAGRDEREPLSDAGRRVAVSQALERLEGKLPYYGSIARRRGFVEKLSSLIADLKQGQLTPQALDDYAATLAEGVTREKLFDLSRIYASYQSVLGERFSDSEDQLDYVARKLEASGCLKDQHVFVYGFDTLPQPMTRLLAAAAPLCRSLTVALICDGETAADAALFTPIREGVERFAAQLGKAGIAVKREALPGQPLDAAPTIQHIDQSLFTYAPARFEGAQDSVYFYSGITPFEEATLMTRQVLRLLEGGMDIERIAVLYPDQNGYAFAVSAALRLSGVPFYADQRLPAMSHGLIRFLLYALRAMAGGYRSADVLGVIKSGYSPLGFDEGCELENYAFRYGINLKRWAAPFTKGDDELRKSCEALRARLMTPLVKARDALVKAKTTQESMTAVFTLLCDVGAYDALKREEKKLLESGLLIRAGQNSQVWQTVMELLDQLVRLEGGARIPLKYIADRLECGFSAISLKSLPPASGMLHAGTLGHSLMSEADAVFLLGLTDEVLRRETTSLLTEGERAAAQAGTGCNLGMTDKSRAAFARLDLKSAMTLPKQLLFLSYAKTAPAGGALRPAALLELLQAKLFDGLGQSPVPTEELPMSAPQALSELSLDLRAHADGITGDTMNARQRDRLTRLLASPVTAPAAMRVLRALDHDGQAQPLTPQEARALYGDEALSVSRLEMYASCPFKHFVTYGLRPQILREWKVDPIETGTFFHAGLDRFARLAKQQPAFPHMEDEAVSALMDEAVQPLLTELMDGPMGDGDRSLARYDQARAALRRAGLTIARHLSAGRFAIDQTEASFGFEGGLPPIVLHLSDGREVMLRGRIDRVDRYDAPDAVYLRVIDYKSSQKTLDAAQTWRGLQLQLLLYLDVLTAAIPDSRPAGAFYFYVADPLVESDSDAQAVVEDKLRALLTLRGITLCDVEVMEAMDAGETPCVLPPVYQKSGELRKDAKALTLTQMTALIRHARATAESLASGLYGGDTAIAPVRDGASTACDHCPVSVDCHFDAEASDAPFNDVPELSMDDMRGLLDGEPSENQR